jgi:hypothetical protein
MYLHRYIFGIKTDVFSELKGFVQISKPLIVSFLKSK